VLYGLSSRHFNTMFARDRVGIKARERENSIARRTEASLFHSPAGGRGAVQLLQDVFRHARQMSVMAVLSFLSQMEAATASVGRGVVPSTICADSPSALKTMRISSLKMCKLWSTGDKGGREAEMLPKRRCEDGGKVDRGDDIDSDVMAIGEGFGAQNRLLAKAKTRRLITC
jgi:hypothetical protein